MGGVSTRLIQTSLLGEALDDGPALLFVADETMRYVAVNLRACKVLGFSREEVLGLSVSEVASYPEAPDEYSEMVQRRVREGTSELRCSDGSTVTMRYVASETVLAGNTFYVAVGFVDEEGESPSTSPSQ